MSKFNDQQKYCRACLREIRNKVTSTYLMQLPEPSIKLSDQDKALTYLQCYYFCLRRDHQRVPIQSLTDYAYICSKCKGHLMKATEFIMNSQRNEDFLMSMYEGSTIDAYESPALAEDCKEFNHPTGATLAQCNSDEFHMVEEYLETSDNESSSNVNEEQHIDDMMESGYDVYQVERIEKIQPILQSHRSTIEAFEEVIIEVPTDNCYVEQTLPAGEDDQHPNSRTFEKYLYFSCELCPKVFNYERHLYEHHSSEHDQKSLGFPCDICKHRLISYKALRYHRRQVHKNFQYVDCDICGSLIISKFYKSHKERHSHRCDECDQTFDSKYAMFKHHKTVHGRDREKRYDCPECKRYFFSRENLRLHSMVHTNNINSGDGRNFTCYICSKPFRRPINLKLHLQWHQGDTMKCPHCTKEFVRLQDMELHMRLHTEDLPFKCSMCSQGYASKDHLNNHMKKHHNVRHQCLICDKELEHSFSLRQHSYQHFGWPFTCKLCGKGFSSVFKTRRHVRTDHGNMFYEGYSDEVADTFYEYQKVEGIGEKVQYSRELLD